MFSKIEKFLDAEKVENKEAVKDMITEMVDALKPEQLYQVVDILKEPFFTIKLNEYLIDSHLPEVDSKEFIFLVEASKYNGNIVRRLMNQADISNYYLDEFIDRYQLKEISKSSFVFPNKRIDAQFLFQAQYSKAVISHETALYLLDLSDVIPQKTIMSMPNSYKLSQLEKNANHYIESYYAAYNNSQSLVMKYEENDPIFITKNKSITESQIVMKATASNNLVRVTSAERTIADILRPNSRVEEEVKQSAIKRYFASDYHSNKRLRRVASELNVLKELDKYLWDLQLAYKSKSAERII